MKTVAKLLTLLLVGVLLLGVFASCKNDTKQPVDTGSDETEDVGDGLYDANGYLKDSLPASYDFNSEFVIYAWEDQKSWEWVEDETIESGVQLTEVEQSLYEREANVEDRFGVDIRRVYKPGEWNNYTTFISTLSQSVLANDHEYDLVDQYTGAAGPGAVNGLYSNLNQSDYLDLSKPWWPESIVETATIGDKLYFVTGDITPLLIRNVQCMFVNLDMYGSYNCASAVGGRTIYQVVNDYDWTVENMLKMALDRVSTDAGDYGISFLNEVTADSFYYGAGFTLLQNTDGILSLSGDLTNNLLINYFDDMKELYTGRYADVAIAGSQVFQQGKSIFYVGNVSDSQVFTTENVKFTVLPMPLLNSDQQEYRTCASLWVSMFSIPVDAKDFTMSGVILEALGSEAYRTVTDEVYYNLFQMRYNGLDSDSAKMFDIVSDSVVCDTARFFAVDLGMFAQFRNGVNSTSGSWTDIYNTNSSSWSQKVTDLYGKIG
ncbi:MAG: hypothetical protein IJW55_04300 [Clostridia bacterium]|nr:hypothetical protein [Clostridia bacterium]